MQLVPRHLEVDHQITKVIKIPGSSMVFCPRSLVAACCSYMVPRCAKSHEEHLIVAHGFRGFLSPGIDIKCHE